MNELLSRLEPAQKDKLEQQEFPGWMDPMLATLTEDRFSDEGWIFERKLDGERCLAFVNPAQSLRLMSRNRKDLNNQYPELVEALKNVPEAMILDGEIVAFEGKLTSFSRLQNRMHVQDPDAELLERVKVFFYLFDLLFLEGYRLTGLPQRTRKSLLKRVLRFEDPLRYMSHRNTRGEDFFHQACRKGWEGIIAKDAGAAYVHGRSKKWLKFKCVQQQEFVIGGYTDPKGERIGFGALLLGYYEEGVLRYAGKVGTGFDDENLERMRAKMEGLEQQSAPFAAPEEIDPAGVHWVQPDLVAEVGFEEWTGDLRLRQPRYLGLREDKAPSEVSREMPS